MKRGDIVVFRGKGIVFQILSFMLGLIDSSWRKRKWKPWHMAICTTRNKRKGATRIIEAVEPKVRERILYDNEDYRAYTWLDKEPSEMAIYRWMQPYISKPYDKDAYAGTIFFSIRKKLFHRSARIVDDEYLCWEIADAFTRDFGKPLFPNNEYPLISDIMNKLEGKPNAKES